MFGLLAGVLNYPPHFLSEIGGRKPYLRKAVLISILILIILGSLNVADQASLAPLVPLIMEDLGISGVALGLVPIYIVVMGVSMMVFGYLSDKYSRRKLILIVALAWTLSPMQHRW